MKPKHIIAIVNNNRRNLELLAQVLEKEGYEPRTASDAVEFERMVESAGDISLALVDIAGIGRDVWIGCQLLREKDVPFIIVSPRQSAAIQEESMSYGARGFLVKPLVIREFLGLIRGLLNKTMIQDEPDSSSFR